MAFAPFVGKAHAPEIKSETPTTKKSLEVASSTKLNTLQFVTGCPDQFRDLTKMMPPSW
jgi:hypothetical protein